MVINLLKILYFQIVRNLASYLRVLKNVNIENVNKYGGYNEKDYLIYCMHNNSAGKL